MCANLPSLTEGTTIMQPMEVQTENGWEANFNSGDFAPKRNLRKRKREIDYSDSSIVNLWGPNGSKLATTTAKVATPTFQKQDGDEEWERGMSLFSNEQYTEAGTIFNKCRGYWPTNAAIDYFTGCCYYNRNKVDKALKAFRTSISEDKNWEGFDHIREGRIEFAKQIIQELSTRKQKQKIGPSQKKISSKRLRKRQKLNEVRGIGTQIIRIRRSIRHCEGNPMQLEGIKINTLSKINTFIATIRRIFPPNFDRERYAEIEEDNLQMEAHRVIAELYQVRGPMNNDGDDSARAKWHFANSNSGPYP